MGILHHRLDCVGALVTGILTYKSESESEKYVAQDDGVFAKSGDEVVVAVRNAVAGPDLKNLHEVIERQFSKKDENERALRATLKKMEAGIIERLAKYRHE